MPDHDTQTTAQQLLALKGFDLLAAGVSSARAARLMGMRPGRLHALIEALEQDCGLRLLERHGRRITPTPAGRALTSITARLSQCLIDAREFASAHARPGQGELRIVAVGPYEAAPILAKLRLEYPTLRITLRESDTHGVIQAVLEQRADAGIVAQASYHEGLHCEPLRWQPLSVFAARSHPLAGRREISLAELCEHEFILPEPDATERRVLEQSCSLQGLRLRCSVVASGREAIREAVVRGMGLGIVADNAFIADPRLVRIGLANADLAIQVHALCRRDRQGLPSVTAFLTTARELYGPLPDRAKSPSRDEQGVISFDDELGIAAPPSP